MGERQSDGGLPGRRRVHPGGPAALDGAALEALLADALRGDGVDAEAEQRAVAAFRAAREAGAHGAAARTRRRDDWRPRARRRAGFSLKGALSVALAGLALGGVAVAATVASGSGGDGAGDDRSGPRPSASAPGRLDAGSSAAAPGAGPARPDHPGTARDTEAHCRAYEQVGARGSALDATAWQRLVAAAGGEGRVAAYCSERLAGATAGAKPDRTGGPRNGTGNGEDAASAANGGPAGENGTAGNGSGTAEGGSGAGTGAENAAGGADSSGNGADNGQGGSAGSNGRDDE
ncbi:hypothetical protein ACIF8T_17685 [Streptomyces sp. NPDC085946]|uniref:hypothetical protein n=1 Tax=Streptomyces sp. NPDC085946 TaxID=3365744 RepID=UPI0037CCE78F